MFLDKTTSKTRPKEPPGVPPDSGGARLAIKHYFYFNGEEPFAYSLINEFYSLKCLI